MQILYYYLKQIRYRSADLLEYVFIQHHEKQVFQLTVDY